MQRTVYDHELPAGARPKQREQLLADVSAAHPDAEVELVTYKPPKGAARYRIVAQLPARRRGRR